MRRSMPLVLFSVVASIASVLLGLTFPPALADQVDVKRVDGKTYSGIVRCMKECNLQDAIDLGMRITGSEPLFDERFECRGIDDGWAIDYSDKRSRPALHGGIDIPAPRGTPILAIADGEVVALFDNHVTAVGVRVFLRHTPEQTGKPFWTYSEYAHLLQLPSLSIGQQVKRGDEVGKTGNTGISGQEARARAGDTSSRRGKVRRDALHFSIMYSDTPDYAVINRNGGYLIPVAARWMDPVAIYRSAPPYDSDTLATLSSVDRKVPIPFQTANGEIHPGESKLIWPYACTPR